MSVFHRFLLSLISTLLLANSGTLAQTPTPTPSQVVNRNNCTTIQNFEFVSEDIKSEITNDTLACCHLCYSNTQCVVWTYDVSTGNCFIKHRELVSAKATNKISGRKQSLDDFSWGHTLVNEDFSNGYSEQWRRGSPSGTIPIANCGVDHLLGGIGTMGKGATLTWKGNTVHPFTRIKIWFRFWFIASWDDEVASLSLNGLKIWNQTNDWKEPGHTKICTTQFSDFFQDVEVMVNLQTSTTNVNLEFTTTLDQIAPDESWAISFFKVAYIPDYSQIPSVMDIQSLLGIPISIYLAGSDFNDTDVSFQITSLPTFGFLSDPEVLVSTNPPQYKEINTVPYKLSAKGLQKVTFTPASSQTNTPVDTQFLFNILNNVSGAFIKEVMVSLHVKTNKPFVCTPPGSPIIHGEVHSIVVDEKVKVVPFSNPYRNPVVFAMPLSANGGDPAVPRISSVDTTGFSLYVQEAPHFDGDHNMETVSYLVLEVGSWRLNSGVRIEVGKTVTSATLGTTAFISDSWQLIEFPSKTEFNEAPIVLAQVQTKNDVHWVKARVAHITSTGFSVALEEEDGNFITHGGEIVGWVAITPSVRELWGTRHFEARRTLDSVTSNWFTILFDAATSRNTVPLFLGDMQSHDKLGSSHLRYTELNKTGVQVKWEHDYRSRTPDSLTTEVVGYLAIESDGDLTGLPSACYSTITLEDQFIQCEEGKNTVISLGPFIKNTAITTKVVTLPTKGRLYQFRTGSTSGELDFSAPIVNPYTNITDPQGWVIYTAYQTFQGTHIDSFTFESINVDGLHSNLGTVTIRVFVFGEADNGADGTPWATSTSASVVVTASNFNSNPNPIQGSVLTLLVIAFVLIAVMAFAIIVFGVFLCKKETARKEMIALFLGDKNPVTGESTYFQNNADDNDV